MAAIDAFYAQPGNDRTKGRNLLGYIEDKTKLFRYENKIKVTKVTVKFEDGVYKMDTFLTQQGKDIKEITDMNSDFFLHVLSEVQNKRDLFGDSERPKMVKEVIVALRLVKIAEYLGLTMDEVDTTETVYEINI